VSSHNLVLRKIAEGVPREQIFEMLLLFGKDEGDSTCSRAIFLKSEDGQEPDAALLKHRLGARSFVSTPILDSNNQVLGTVAFGCAGEYPTSYDLRVQEACAGLASVVLQRDRGLLERQRAEGERQRAEGERQEALRETQVLADLAPQMFFTARADGWVDYFNEKWSIYTGSSAQETQGWNWRTVVHPEDLAHTVATWTHAVTTGEPYQVEARLKRASDGMYRWHLGRALPSRGAAGEVVKWFGTATDIHDQKTENERLEAVVEARTEQLTRLLTEKETLLKEVHHRVKNNLQVISSLLRMHGEKVHDPLVAAALADSRRRVISMALIHEQLYGNQQMNAIDFGEYALTLVNELFSSCSFYWEGREGRNISSRIEAVSVLLRIDQAIPCGLILNELVTNALKYAYPAGTGGEVLIELKVLEKGLEQQEVFLSVSDQGVGMPSCWQLKNKGSLGLLIVDMLAKQLGGKLTHENGPGTRFTVSFPAQ
jgi:PAS domain S-box-containing protein